MKIAHFIGTLKKEDGVTRVLIALVKEAQKRGIESIIITGWAEDASISPVPVLQIPSIIFPLYKEYRLSLPGIHGFAKRLDEFKPDIIHIHSPDTIAWSALKYAKKRRIPIMATYHTNFIKYLSYYHLSFLQPIIWFLFRRLYNQMSFVTTPSPVITQELISHKINNVQTIPWGVELANFNPSHRSIEWREKILKKKKAPILLCVCRLVWEKDLKTLAKAYNLLKQNRNDFIMVIAGNGPAREELESLMPGTIFLGHLEGRALYETYASSDIFIFPSTTETFGNVTIEAMASGLVPIVADAGGSKSLIKNGENGLLTEPKNPQDIYKKINILLDNKKLQEKMKIASSEFSKKFTWEKVFENIYQIYLNLSANILDKK